MTTGDDRAAVPVAADPGPRSWTRAFGDLRHGTGIRTVAGQMVALQRRLADRVRELEAALAQIKRLQGILPVCAWCKAGRPYLMM